MKTPDNRPAPAHAMKAAAVVDSLRSAIGGLASQEAEIRLASHGPNRLPEVTRRSVFLRFLSQFHNILVYVLLGATAITASLGHLVDAGVILAVVAANAVIGFIQEGISLEQLSRGVQEMRQS